MLPNLSVLWVIFFILVLTFVVDRGEGRITVDVPDGLFDLD